METIKVNMSPNPLDVQTIHASQNDGEARQWEFELHNNGELIDTSDVKEQMVFKAYKGGTEQLLPENTSTPTTSPFLGDIKYPQGLLTDQEFTYRQSPTEEDGLAKITDIKGNTLVWNQLVQNGNFADGISYYSPSSATITASDGILTITKNQNTGVGVGYARPTNLKFVLGHKYFARVDYKGLAGKQLAVFSDSPNAGMTQFTLTDENWHTIYRIFTANVIPSVPGILWLMYATTTDDNVAQFRNYAIFDLTEMFGSGNEPSTVEEFTSIFSLPYYSYNQGSLLSFNGNGIKTTGKNLINLGVQRTVTANGVTASYDDSTQKVTLSGTNTKTDSAYILIDFAPSAIPKFKIGETYVVSTSSQIPTNTYFNLVYRDANNARKGLSLTQIETRRAWRFTVPSNYSTLNSFQIGILKEARQLNGEFGVQLEFGSTATAYEPYTSSTLSLPISTYFPTGMKSAGTVYDELTPTKAITRIGIVDMGTLPWTMTTSGVFRVYKSDAHIRPKVLTPFFKYFTDNFTYAIADSLADGTGGVKADNQNIYYKDSNFTSVEALKSAMSGVYLYYELATPTETPITTASLVTENAEIPLSNEDGVLIGKCTEQLSENPGFIDAKIKLSDADGECYSNKIQLHVERSPQ